MIQELGKRMEAWIEKIQVFKDLEKLKDKQTLMSKTKTEMKKTPQEQTNRISEAEEPRGGLEDRPGGSGRMYLK